MTLESKLSRSTDDQEGIVESAQMEPRSRWVALRERRTKRSAVSGKRKRIARFLRECIGVAHRDDLSDTIDRVCEYKSARQEANRYLMLRNINR